MSEAANCDDEDQIISIDNKRVFAIDPQLSSRAKKRLRKAGVGVEPKWHEIPEVKELTEEDKDDIEILGKRQVLVNDHRVKRGQSEFKRFQKGVTVDDPGSFHDRIPRKDRRQTIVDEILANSEIMRQQRKKHVKLERDSAIKRLQLRKIAQKKLRKTKLKGNRKPLHKSVVEGH